MAGRFLLMQWKDKRSGYSRRIRWYKGANDIRLEMEDKAYGIKHFITSSHTQAQFAWDRFREGMDINRILELEKEI